MAQYVYVDESGNELRREDKGRGRVRSGAEQRADGNFYIVERAGEASPATKPVTVTSDSNEDATKSSSGKDAAKVDVSNTSMDAESDLQEIPKNGSARIVKNKVPVDAHQLAAACFTSAHDRQVTPNYIDLRRIVIIRETGIESIPFNCVKRRILIDLKTGEIKMWSDNEDQAPQWVILNGVIVNPQTPV